jgi:hypothetical protein
MASCPGVVRFGGHRSKSEKSGAARAPLSVEGWEQTSSIFSPIELDALKGIPLKHFELTGDIADK